MTGSGLSARRSSHPPRVSPFVWVLACVALAVLSWATLPTVPSYDPWSWIVWGREVSDPHLAFAVGGGPSWKPLPFLFTTVYGLLGAAAPTLWVITARAGGLLGLLAAGRLGHRLAGGGPAGIAAGLVAAAGIALTQDWGYYMMRGASEPGLVACTLWALDRLLAGRHPAALALAVAAALIRPEWWPFLALYAAWLAWRGPGFAGPAGRAGILAGLIVVPVLWFGPPWIGSGHPLLAATHAREYDGHLGPDPLRAVLVRGVDLQPSPALIGALLAVVLGVGRERRAVTGLAVGVVAWWAVVVALTLDGYPGLERFYLPAAAVTCVLGGVGLVRLAEVLGRALGSRLGAGAGWAAPLVLVGLLGLATPLVLGRASALAGELPAARQAHRLLDGLARTARAAGSTEAILPCPTSFVAVNHSAQTALAWILHVPLERVSGTMSRPGLDFVGPRVAATGEAPPVDPRLTRARPVLRRGAWRVVRRTDPRHPGFDACVGR